MIFEVCITLLLTRETGRYAFTKDDSFKIKDWQVLYTAETLYYKKKKNERK